MKIYICKGLLGIIELDGGKIRNFNYTKDYISSLFTWNTTRMGCLFYNILNVSMNKFKVFDYEFAIKAYIRYGYTYDIYLSSEQIDIYIDSFKENGRIDKETMDIIFNEIDNNIMKLSEYEKNDYCNRKVRYPYIFSNTIPSESIFDYSEVFEEL